MKIKNKAAQELGRLGGKVKSQTKTEAARLNAKKSRKPVTQKLATVDVNFEQG